MKPQKEFAQVADGVHRLHVGWVNCYVVVTSDGMTLIDAGLPGAWRALGRLLDSLGARPRDLDALILTHGHFDHVGMADRLQREHGTPTLVHPADQKIARHPYRYEHQAARLPYPFRHPSAVPLLGSMAAHGALWVRGVDTAGTIVPGVPVDVPGRPVPVPSPGHTAGHCGFHLESAGVLLTGDAIVTLDPYTGATGPRIVANAATADSDEALDSLDAFLAVDAQTLLPGHGEPWGHGVRAAVDEARRHGPS
jgi:glyoxylase-like metal-dependent hydrolase (beta-lactamase superfamily II)